MAWKQACEGTPHDFSVVARRVVEQAIRERLDGSPLPQDTKNPRFKAMGKTGGPKGGRARADALVGAKEKRASLANRVQLTTDGLTWRRS